MHTISKLTAGVLSLVLALPASGLAETRTGLDRAGVEKIIQEHLLANPELVERALMVLQERRDREASVRSRAAIAENREALLGHPLSPVSGNPGGDVTVVEFFDYLCGFCKRSLKPVVDLLESDARVRVVWKELPVLGPVSDFAARASMAADRQGRYHDFHVALMGAPERLTEASVMRIARETGLDAEKLRRDMADPAIAEYIGETRRLAQTLGIRGTPAFVIGGDLVRGAVDGPRLKQLVAEARDAR